MPIHEFVAGRAEGLAGQNFASDKRTGVLFGDSLRVLHRNFGKLRTVLVAAVAANVLADKISSLDVLLAPVLACVAEDFAIYYSMLLVHVWGFFSATALADDFAILFTKVRFERASMQMAVAGCSAVHFLLSLDPTVRVDY